MSSPPSASPGSEDTSTNDKAFLLEVIAYSLSRFDIRIEFTAGLWWTLSIHEYRWTKAF